MKKLILPTCMILLLAACDSGKDADRKPAPLDPDTPASSGNPAMAPVDYLGGVARGKKKAEAGAALAQIQQGITAFKTVEGRNPKNLDEVVKNGYLNAMPKAPYGMKFTYNPQTGEPDVVMAEQPKK